MNSVLTLANTLNLEKQLDSLDLNVEELVEISEQSHSAVRTYNDVCSKKSMGRYGTTII